MSLYQSVVPLIVSCLAGLPAPFHRCHALGVAVRCIETFLRYPRQRLEAEAGPGGHEIRTWITIAGTAGDARGSLLAYQPVPARSAGCAVAALEPR